jgi:hypothetical protein
MKTLFRVVATSVTCFIGLIYSGIALMDAFTIFVDAVSDHRVVESAVASGAFSLTMAILHYWSAVEYWIKYSIRKLIVISLAIVVTPIYFSIACGAKGATQSLHRLSAFVIALLVSHLVMSVIEKVRSRGEN